MFTLLKTECSVLKQRVTAAQLLVQLLTPLLCATHLLNDCQGGVEVQPAQDVPHIESVHCAVAFKVID